MTPELLCRSTADGSRPSENRTRTGEPEKSIFGGGRIFTRYLLRECFLFFAISLFAFTGILLTIQMLRLSSLVINKGVGAGQIALVFVAVVPTFLEIAVPLAGLLGVMLAFARLSGDSEIVVIRASGVSLYELLKPVALFGLFLAAACFVVSHQLKPWGHARLSDTLFEIARTKSTAGLEEGVFNKLGALTLYAEQIESHTGALERVLVDDKRGENERKVIFAKRGKIISDPARRLITFHLYDGVIDEIILGKYIRTQFEANRLEMTPDDLYNPEATQKGKGAREMRGEELLLSLAALDDLAARVGQGEEITHDELPPILKPQLSNQTIDAPTLGRKINRIRVEQQMRNSMPLASLVLAFLAMPLGIQPPRMQRTWGAGLSALVGMLVFLCYYGLLSVGITMSETGTFSPVVAMWLPNVVAAVAAAFAVQRVSSERWHSVAQGAEEIGRFVRTLIPRYRRT